MLVRVITLTWLPGTITSIRSYSRVTNACSVNSRQHTWRKKKQLHKSLKHCTETASMKWSQSSPRSWPIWPLSLQHPCSAERSFSRLRRLKIYLWSTMEQKRLNSHASAIVCTERFYGNKVIVNTEFIMITRSINLSIELREYARFQLK